MTAEGYARLEVELKQLKTVERPAVIKAIAEARDHGDLSENAEYHAARERQSFIEGRVAELEDKIARAEVIDVSRLTGKVIKFGAKVTLADVYLVPQVANARRFDVPLDEFPRIVAADRACAELEAFRRAAPENQPDAA